MSDHIIFILRLWAMGICLICTEQINAQVNLPKVLDSLEHTLDTMPSTVAKAKRLNQIAFFYLNIDAQKTREYARRGLALAEQVQSDEQIGQAHNALASYHVYASERENAVASYELAMQYFRKIGYEKGIANILGNLGVMHYVSGEYAKALDYIFQSLKVFEKIGDPLGQGNELSAAANIYMEQKKFDLAIHYDTLALKQYQKINDSNGIALVTGNLANIYKDIGETTKAKTAYDQALAIYRKTGDAQGIARNLVNFALFLHTERNYADASRNLSEAKEIFRKVNSNQGLTHATGNQGLSHFLSYLKYHRKDSLFILVPGSRESLLTKAISLLEESIRLSQKSNDLNGLVTYAKILSNAYSEKQDVANAFKYFKIYASAQDSLSSIDSKKAIEKLTTEREVELKNKQIELDRLAVEKKRNERAYFGAGMCLLLISMLFIYRNYANQKKSNTQLASLNQQIAESNAELTDKNLQLTQTMQELEATQEQLIESEKQKENALIRSRISQDIHDDISAGLTKISWLAESFMAKTAHTNALPDLGILQKINDYSRETVSKLGEIIWSANPERDNLESLLDYIRRYVTNYMEDAAIQYHLAFPNELPNVMLHPALRRNLYLVTKEALHNARKYSNATDIHISFTLHGQQFKLSVQDNGRGMSPNEVQGTGNGLHNMRKRMEAIGGNLSIESIENQGTTLTFTGALDM